MMSDLRDQIETATTLGLDEVGLPISSDEIESLFGVAKQHGAGEIKDAARLALRLPALCGAPNREEAEQVLQLSVAEQNEIIGSFPSLIKKRREVLTNPARLESLGTDQPHGHVELIPGAKNRSKNQGKLLNINEFQRNTWPPIKPQENYHYP